MKKILIIAFFPFLLFLIPKKSTEIGNPFQSNSEIIQLEPGSINPQIQEKSKPKQKPPVVEEPRLRRELPKPNPIIEDPPSIFPPIPIPSAGIPFPGSPRIPRSTTNS